MVNAIDAGSGGMRSLIVSLTCCHALVSLSGFDTCSVACLPVTVPLLTSLTPYRYHRLYHDTCCAT